MNTAVSARKVGTGFLPADTPKHKSAVWGYYAAADVEVVGETRGYSRSDYPDPAVRIHSCGACGVTTHWTLTEDFAAKHPEEAGRMGVNMRLFDDAAKAGVELRFPDGAAWDGEGEYGYVRDAVVVPEQ
ncbi:MAG: aldehyde-activating protein [Sphingorhabdus sp.]